ncbi:MAG TPA: PEGA domain-containing protein, partial [Vulgatibacter sp.]
VLPGERTIRVELATYKTFEKTEQIPVRGKTQVSGALKLLPGNLHVISSGARIFVDGEEKGSDEVNVPTSAGTHVVSLRRDGYEDFETQVEVSPDGTTKLEHDLDPTFWKSVVQTASREQDEIYKESGYFAFTFENRTLTSPNFGAKTLAKELDRLVDPALAETSVQAFGIEVGSVWKYVGMTWFGASYFRTGDTWSLSQVGGDPDDPDFTGTIDGGSLRLLHPQLRLALWRFVLGVRGGLALNVGVVSGVEGEDGNNLVFGGVDAEAMGTLQLRLVGGLYAEGGYGRTWGLASFFGKPGSSDNLRLGVGYAY